MLNWIKWFIAPKEMAELERWRIEWQTHRQWFAEFPAAACALEHMKCAVDGEPVTNIMTVRDSCRAIDPLLKEPKHQTNGDCWCHPVLDYKDPETGAEVWIHNKPH